VPRRFRGLAWMVTGGTLGAGDPMARLAAVRHSHHNLPAQATALLGRDQDVANVCQLVLEDEGRLVTLTGVGGCGKTRLAIAVGATLVSLFKDGVVLVTLAPLVDPLLIPQAVALVLGVPERSDRSLVDALVAYLERRHLLLILDNCEHMLHGCSELADALLQGCPRVRLLATSRELLRNPGERAWRVSSLATPDTRSAPGPNELLRYPAAQLFVQRAQAVQPDFVVTPASAPVVAAICARLEGLPLAIELAAAWVRVLGVQQILERLDDAFALLVGGSRSAPNRQQTMRATLDWSYGLLGEAARVIFRRLAVFVDGWSLEAAEAVCSGSGIPSHDVLNLLTRLVDASLVQVEERNGRARYRLLEPVRQYAHQHLMTSSESDAIRRQHAAFFISFAERWEADANLGGPGRHAAFAALESELDNMRAVLRWCLEQSEAEMGLRLARAHWVLWVVRGRFNEGGAWLTQLVALPDAVSAPALRAVALSIAASMARRQGSYDSTVELDNEVLPLLRQAHENLALEKALVDLGYIAMQRGDLQGAEAFFQESLTSARATGHRVNEAVALVGLGWVSLRQGDSTMAQGHAEESLAVSRAFGDSWVLSLSLDSLGYIMLHQGDDAAARRLLEEGAVLARQIRSLFQLATSLDALGQLATREGCYGEARAVLRESLCLRQDLGDRLGVGQSLESIAALAASERHKERAVQLAGAAAGIRDAIGAPPNRMDRALLDTWLLPLRQLLSAEAAASAWDEGRHMPVEQALDLALAATDDLPAQANRPALLSPREQEVAALLAHGLSNRQISEQLVITERTVAAHVEHILRKLTLSSRHQVAAWAPDHGVVA
jgi:predicted ATPase/DNA-binding CsgD family transcriptional regulator